MMRTQEAMRRALTTITPDQLRERADSWLTAHEVFNDSDPLWRAMAIEQAARSEVARQAEYEALLTTPN